MGYIIMFYKTNCTASATQRYSFSILFPSSSLRLQSKYWYVLENVWFYWYAVVSRPCNSSVVKTKNIRRTNWTQRANKVNLSHSLLTLRFTTHVLFVRTNKCPSLVYEIHTKLASEHKNQKMKRFLPSAASATILTVKQGHFYHGICKPKQN